MGHYCIFFFRIRWYFKFWIYWICFGSINNGTSSITTLGKGSFEVEIDDILINNNFIGHKDDTNLIELSNQLVTINGIINLSTNNSYKINDVVILSDTELGSSVVTSSLQTVGALDSGSITSNFGSINTGSSNIETLGKGSFGILEVDDCVINGSNIGHKNDTDLIILQQQS